MDNNTHGDFSPTYLNQFSETECSTKTLFAFFIFALQNGNYQLKISKIT